MRDRCVPDTSNRTCFFIVLRAKGFWWKCWMRLFDNDLTSVHNRGKFLYGRRNSEHRRTMRLNGITHRGKEIPRPKLSRVLHGQLHPCHRSTSPHIPSHTPTMSNDTFAQTVVNDASEAVRKIFTDHIAAPTPVSERAQAWTTGIREMREQLVSTTHFSISAHN